MSALESTARAAWLARALALFLLLALGGAGCGQGECDKCTSDSDCPSGLVCSTFRDGSQRCASGTGATQCRVW
jgi:hypothetical protein